MKRLSFSLCLAGIFSTANAMAETLSLSCPGEIMTEQQAKAPPAGWEPSIAISDLSPKNGHWLDAIGFYSGPPKDGALLAPDQTKTVGKKSTNTWELQPAKEKYWFACAYRATKVILTKQLPDQPMRCEAQYSGDSLVPVDLTCRTHAPRIAKK